MTKSDTLPTAERIARLTADVLGLATVPEPHESLDALGADSLGLVELSMAAEEEFNIAISDDDLEDIRTVADLATLCDRLQGVAA